MSLGLLWRRDTRRVNRALFTANLVPAKSPGCAERRTLCALRRQGERDTASAGHGSCTEGLRFVRPRIFAQLSDAQLQSHLNAEVAKLVKRARDDMALRRLPFVGRNAVLRQSFSAIPKTPAPRRNPSPRIAAKSTPARVDAIRRMLDFCREYRAAWTEWRSGNRAVVFPVGTYALRIYARVACAQAVPA